MINLKYSRYFYVLVCMFVILTMIGCTNGLPVKETSNNSNTFQDNNNTLSSSVDNEDQTILEEDDSTEDLVSQGEDTDEEVDLGYGGIDKDLDNDGVRDYGIKGRINRGLGKDGALNRGAGIKGKINKGQVKDGILEKGVACH